MDKSQDQSNAVLSDRSLHVVSEICGVVSAEVAGSAGEKILEKM
jgi:hypothetical protein